MVTSAQIAACNNVTNINQALTSLSNVNASTTVGEVKNDQAKITSSVSTMASRVSAADNVTLALLTTANAQLTSKLASYPDQTPIGKTSVNVQGIKSSAANVQSQTTKLSSDLKCTS
jgi:hypothetical protein